MNPCELTASITALANALACRLNEDELNLLGVTLTQLGDTLLTIATQRTFAAAILHNFPRKHLPIQRRSCLPHPQNVQSNKNALYVLLLSTKKTSPLFHSGKMW